MACSHPVALVLGNDLWSYTHVMEREMTDTQFLVLVAVIYLSPHSNQSFNKLMGLFALIFAAAKGLGWI